MDRKFYTYNEIANHNPIQSLAKKSLLSEDQIEEIYRLCNMDSRFYGSGEVRYTKLSEYIGKTWRVPVKPRRLKYIYRIIFIHNELLDKLRRGALMPEDNIDISYRDEVLRKA